MYVLEYIPYFKLINDELNSHYTDFKIAQIKIESMAYL